MSATELRRQLGLSLQHELPPLLLVAALVHLAAALIPWERPPASGGQPLVQGLFLTAGYAAVAALLARLKLLGARWSQPVAAGLAALFLGNCFLQFAAHPSPQISLPLMLGLIAFSQLFLFTGWHVALMLAGASLWWQMASTAGFPGLWPVYGLGVAASIALGSWIHWSRARRQRQLEILRLETDPQRNHLPMIAEQARRNEIRYRGLWNAGFDGLVLHDQGEILDANDAVCNLFGRAKSDLVGKHFSCFLAEESRAGFSATARFGNFQSTEVVGLLKDGARANLLLFNQTVPWGENEVTIMAVRDCTGQRQRDALLHRENDRMELAARRQAALTALDLASAQPAGLGAPSQQVVEAASSLLRVSVGACLILADADRKLVIRASTIPSLSSGLSIGQVRPESALGHVLESQEPLIMPTTDLASFKLEEHFPVRGVGAYAAYPVLRRDEAIGVLLVLDGEPRHYTTDDLAFLEVLASRLGWLASREEIENQLRLDSRVVEEQREEIQRLKAALTDALRG